MTDDRGVDDFLDWELMEQQIIVDNKIPCFEVPQGNDLDKDTKKYSILQLVPPGVRGKFPFIFSIIDEGTSIESGKKGYSCQSRAVELLLLPQGCNAVGQWKKSPFSNLETNTWT